MPATIKNRMPRSTTWAALGLTLTLTAGLSMAQTAAVSPPAAAPASDQGYSFVLGLARHHATYREFASTVPVVSRVSTASPMLITGALYAVSRDLLFSLSSESTYFQSTDNETWRSTAPVFNGITLTDRVLQTNAASLNHTETHLLVHHRLAGETFLVAGPSLRTHAFKRHSFQAGADAAVTVPDGATVEETATEVLLQVGAALEPARVRGASAHYGLRATVGMPVVRRVENTNHPGLRFSQAKGLDVGLEGRYSAALIDGVHLGAWGRWAASRRQAQVLQEGGTTLELPRSRTDTLSYGVELLWKL